MRRVETDLYTKPAVAGRVGGVGKGEERNLGQGQRWLPGEFSERAAGRRSIVPA